jgi:hypothetical protein
MKVGFIPLELRVKPCQRESRNCKGQVHLYHVQFPEPGEMELCAWHGQLEPRVDSNRPAEEARRARRRRANQEGIGFGNLSRLGRGQRANSLET